jgi:Ras-related protein Rab-11A
MADPSVPGLDMKTLCTSEATAAAAAGSAAARVTVNAISPRANNADETLPVRVSKQEFDETTSFLRLKVVMVGPSGVGKSSLISRLMGTADRPAINAQPGTFDSCFLRYRYGTKFIMIELWDTCGHERYNALKGHYYRGLHAAIAVCDLTMTGEEVRESLVNEIKVVQDHAGDSPIVLVVANKCDLVEYRQVPRDMLPDFCSEYKFQCMEASAVDGTNVERAFATVVLELFARNIASLQSARARNGVTKGAFVPGKSAMGSQSKSSSIILPGIALAVADPNVSPRPAQRQASMPSPRKKPAPSLCQLI